MSVLPSFQPLVMLFGLLVGLVALYLITLVLPIAAFITFAEVSVPTFVVQPFVWLNGLYYTNPYNFGAGFVLGFLITFCSYARKQGE